MSEILRVYVEKKEGFNIEAKKLLSYVNGHLGIKSVTGIRILNCYDVGGLDKAEFDVCAARVISEANTDLVYTDFEFPSDAFVFGKTLLPGQYDQRADWAALCTQVMTGKLPDISFTKFFILDGDITNEEKAKILKDAINPVESMQVDPSSPPCLNSEVAQPTDVIEVDIMNKDAQGLEVARKAAEISMNAADFEFLRDYFKTQENRNPTITEVKMIDTYWSDHCRHTTFFTALDDISFEEGPLKGMFVDAFNKYKQTRERILTDDRPITLMDIATIGAKALYRDGHVQNLDISEEVNAASIVIDVEFTDGEKEEWLLMFKNETHNHPTEIEPFGGAATCIGGAIRDPLSGRAYVYQAMRVTGSADPRKFDDEGNENVTIKGKLPQHFITTQAAQGYSSYGNQIGLATGLVKEIYHPGYVAKRMEVGAVIGAVKKENVVRKVPQLGDVVLLVGGRTGRDGVGGASGSSVERDEESLQNAGAEVQKGNPIIERKLQRLFRNPDATKLIIRCNDFGAGGVSVAIGELADSLEVNLDLVRTKYEGLNGTELAISESQERMAVVVHAQDAQKFIDLAFAENLEAYEVAKITDTGRLTMTWRGKKIVDFSREFLNTSGLTQKADIYVAQPQFSILNSQFSIAPPTLQAWIKNLQELNVAGQKGLVEQFDSTVGAGTVLAPFGGSHQLTPTQVMAARIPVLGREAVTASVMSYGFDPYISEQSPYHGAVHAVVESVAKMVSAGVDYKEIRMSFQEYFERLTTKEKWGKPFAALLGAYTAQMELKLPAIGGKDSMSGSYEGKYHVPPTLISFTAASAPIANIISPEFKNAGNKIYLLKAPMDANGIPCFDALKINFELMHKFIVDKAIVSAHVPEFGGIAESLSKMAFGNKIGANVDYAGDYFAKHFGAFAVEATADLPAPFEQIGTTTDDATLTINGTKISIEECITAWMTPLEEVFPTGQLNPIKNEPKTLETFKGSAPEIIVQKNAKPRVFVPVFPGTNSEYDMAESFRKAGGEVDYLVIKNLTHDAFKASMLEMEKRINQAQIIAISGGFSAGDEPEGSGKFIAAVFSNPAIMEATHALLNDRKGLMIGICNGFQALVKTGLLPYGKIQPITENSPTLTSNAIGRHISTMTQTKVISKMSPWLANAQLEGIYRSATSHGQGRFVASEEKIHELNKNGQIFSIYVDNEGELATSLPHNPNGSMYAIEGITDPTGRVLGKMAHSERGKLYRNIPGEFDAKIFKSGINYFS